MNLYFDDFIEGLQEGFKKESSDVFSSSPNNASLFPTLNSQSKWKFSRGDKFLRLHDGQKVYAFSFPSGISHDEEFHALREPDHEPTKFEEGSTSKGLAQVHRADPGSIYFTLQEGKQNPTFTLKHTGENNWRGVPKKRKAKEVVIPNVNLPAVQEGIKAAFEELGKKKVKIAGGLDAAFKWSVSSLPQAIQRGVMAPGEAVHRMGGSSGTTGGSLQGMAGLAGLGALGGLGYHVGRRALYNTSEENAAEDEQGKKLVLKRMLVPAAGLGVLGGLQQSMLPEQYKDIAAGAGRASKLIG